VIPVDSSVWFDYLRGVSTPQADKLDALLGTKPLAVGDLILAEVLRGRAREREFQQVRLPLDTFATVKLAGEAVAIQVVKNFRTLRVQGVTVRKTIDTTIATRCILDGLTRVARGPGLRCVRHASRLAGGVVGSLRWRRRTDGRACPGNRRPAPRRQPLLVEEAAAVEAPGRAVVEVEVPVGTEVLARKELAVGLGHQARELFLAQFVELLRRDRLPDSESARFHE
jgi:hypothetical protein